MSDCCTFSKSIGRTTHTMRFIGMAMMLIASCWQTQLACGDDWTVIRGNSQSTGFAPGTMAARPELLWEFSAEKTAFEGTAIIADGHVFVGDVDGTLYAIDCKSGEPTWKQTMKNGFVSAGAYREGKLVIGDFDGKIYCLNASDGEKRWEYEIDQQIASGPNFFEDIVLVTSESGTMTAIDFASGNLKWEYQTGDQLRSGPTIWKHFALLGGCDGKLHKVDLRKGEPADSGLPLDGPTGSTPAVIDHVAIVPTQSGEVLAFDLETGARLWSFADAERVQEIRCSPAVVQGTSHWMPAGMAIVTTRNKRVLGLNIADGTMAWEAVLKKRSDSSAVVCDGRVWVGATDGRLYALDLMTGNETWTYQAKGGLIASPAISNGQLIIATDKGTVLCFGSK